MPVVEVRLLAGRSVEVKAELAKELTEVVQRHLGSDPQRIQILVTEYEPGTWYAAGESLSAPVADGSSDA
ncbi:putative enzyme [metagenome]|uniref:Putative enzyme n=1 Tax=metagenome TaxID=256318 RepID=A0A2P2C9X9_9ZZZZ